MKTMKKLLAVIVAFMMTFATYCAPVFAAPDAFTAKLFGTVTDAGQVVSKVEIDYGSSYKVDSATVTKDTFKVHCKGTNPESYNVPATETSYNAKEFDRAIVKVEVSGQYVNIYLDESEGGTLTYLASAARNIPLDLKYTITQNAAVTLTAADGTVLDDEFTGTYTCDNTIEDAETAKYTSVTGSQGINYQYHEGSNDSLVVWFHGNGEGDYKSSGNNVAQLLANRGTVAWSTDEAQAVFGDTTVMAFQAPDTWYYAQSDGLLEKAYKEIQEVIASKGIDASKVYVSGCSAGGYMTTRMLIAYPDLFKAAMINCPALDVADARGGETPTDEELKTLKNSKTAIWLVQADNDETVKTADCSQRLFDILTEGQTLTTTTVAQDLYSDFTTSETSDNKYKLSLYETNEDKKLSVAEDYDQDGIATEVTYSNHWSWIYTLLNNPSDASGTNIWNWAVNYATPKTNANNTVKPTDSAVKSVKTGDNSSLELFAAISTIAVLAGGYVATKANKA